VFVSYFGCCVLFLVVVMVVAYFVLFCMIVSFLDGHCLFYMSVSYFNCHLFLVSVACFGWLCLMFGGWGLF